MVKGIRPLLVGRSCIVAISTVGILIIPVVITVVIGICFDGWEDSHGCCLGFRDFQRKDFKGETEFHCCFDDWHDHQNDCYEVYFNFLAMFNAVQRCSFLLEREARCNVCVFRLRIGENLVSWIIMSFSTHGDCSL